MAYVRFERCELFALEAKQAKAAFHRAAKGLTGIRICLQRHIFFFFGWNVIQLTALDFNPLRA